MQIGQVIRKYRKSKDMTQEEMAIQLGVTVPMVNKWENGNSLPDIMMLAPIARLLDISLDTLLTFQGDLTDEEVNNLIKVLNEKLEAEEFEDVFQWAKRQMEQYPNCEHLLLWMSVELMAYQWSGFQTKGHEAYFLAVLQRLLCSGEETTRTTAAECLYNYYMQQEKYDRAETYLSYFSVQSPERKRKEALLYARTGRIEEAYRSYEELLFSESQILHIVFSSLMSMRLKEQDMEKAAYLAEKRVQLVRLFEMGRYQEASIRLEMAQAQEDIEGTLHWAKEMTADLGEIAAFRDAPLYGHMSFREVSDEFRNKMQERLDALFQGKDSFEYMKGNERWENFLKDRER